MKISNVQKYADIIGIGKLEAAFQQVPLVQTFWNLHHIIA